jgi:soluble lytic murein transglycosylase-like protein
MAGAGSRTALPVSFPSIHVVCKPHAGAGPARESVRIEAARKRMHKTLFTVVAAWAVLGIAVPVRAELVFFSSGRSMSVKGHRAEGDAIVLVLRAGGEIVCEPATIARITPDEVPYPEPEAEAPPQVVAAPPPTAAPAAPYGEIIDRFAREQNVPAKLVRAVIQVESAYNERARSKKGAMGLMQLMPETARQYAVRDPYDPTSNIDAGIRHLRALLDRLPTMTLAIAAYNAGEAAVQRFRGVPPYPETRDYVRRVLDLFSK